MLPPPVGGDTRQDVEKGAEVNIVEAGQQVAGMKVDHAAGARTGGSFGSR